MATGSVVDIFNRLKKNLVDWFGTDTPVLDAILIGKATTASFIYNLTGEANLQTRIRTATGENLDFISKDFFGDTFPRRDDETDNSYRNRILANLLQLKATRPAMQSAIFALTGIQPVIFEPWRPADCGCLGGVTSNNYTMGYSAAGLYGSYSYPYQAFIDVYVPEYQGMANYAGYNNFLMGYNAAGAPARGWYGGESLLDIVVTNDDVYQLINNTKVFGTIVWVRIHNGGEKPPMASLLYDSLGSILTDSGGDPLIDGI